MDIIFFGAGFWGQQAYKKYKVNNYKNQLRGFMDNKKTGEYVQVGKVYGNKRFTYTNKKVKGGKTYYYKVAAYKKASGQVIYGNKSKVKSIKK